MTLYGIPSPPQKEQKSGKKVRKETARHCAESSLQLSASAAAARCCASAASVADSFRPRRPYCSVGHCLASGVAWFGCGRENEDGFWQAGRPRHDDDDRRKRGKRASGSLFCHVYQVVFLFLPQVVLLLPPQLAPAACLDHLSI